MNSRAKHIVLIGIGHTNSHVVKQWATDPIPGCTLSCISKFSTATYSGMLPGTLAGQFFDDEMRIDLQSLADRANAELIIADVRGLNLQTGEIHFNDRESISFDALSIGVGSIPAGWQQHADSPLLVTIKPMQTFLDRLGSRLQDVENTGKKSVHVAIVGGGVASVEIAFCLQEQYRKRDATCEISIEIFTSSDHVADGMSGRSIRRTEKLLARRGIAVRCGHRVTDVSSDSLTTDDGRCHSTDCVIWATGAAAPLVLGNLGLQTDAAGFVATSNTLQSLSDPRIFAVGDSGTVIDSPSPKAGVYAVRQCPILWHNIRVVIQGGTMQTFRPQSDFLKLLNTGDGKALLEYRWFSAHARWCWSLKTWIDKRFIHEFKLDSYESITRKGESCVQQT